MWMLVFILTVSFMFQFYSSVMAQSLSQSEIDAINGWPNWAPSLGAQCAGSGSSGTTTVNVTITGNNVKDAYNFFISNGYSAFQAAGIVGNLMYESDGTGGDIIPTKNEVGGSGYGIAQFTGDELTRMRAWVTANGEDPTSLQGQLDYLLYDLRNNYQTVVSGIKATSTVADATQVFEIQYERPQGSDKTPIYGDAASSLSDRTKDAQAAYNQYSGGPAVTSITTSGNGTCSPPTIGSPDCTVATGNSKILCEAKRYNGIYYEWDGGHQGYAAFVAACPDPSNPPNNQPSGGPVNGDPGGLSGNPSPCATDCSGLVSIAVDAAFNQNFSWSVSFTLQGSGSQYWQPVPIAQVQPGDIVTTSDHVEIVDHYSASAGLLYTFGSHDTGTTTGEISSTLSYWSGAYRYTGPES